MVVIIAARKQIKKKVCSACGAELPLARGFYSTQSPLFAIDKKINICKDCFISNSLNEETGEIDELKFKNMLRKTDFPYYRDVIQSSAMQFLKDHSYVDEKDVKFHGAEIAKLYMKNINSLPQFKYKSFEESEKDGFIHPGNKLLKSANDDIKMLNNDIAKKARREEKYFSDNEEFELTDDIVQLFGEGYTKGEYCKMYKKYEKLKLNYSLQTNLHQETLATYVRFKVKEEDATARGDVDEAKKWYDAAQNAAASGKLTPKQLSESDLHGGINSFSEIFKAVEQAVDVIPILPQFKYRPNDALDFVIWCYINYVRNLQGLPECSYEDIYKFYDKKKQEYIDQYGDPYGIFEDDPTPKNRDNIKKFITLPKGYNTDNN